MVSRTPTTPPVIESDNLEWPTDYEPLNKEQVDGIVDWYARAYQVTARDSVLSLALTVLRAWERIEEQDALIASIHSFMAEKGDGGGG